MRVSGGAGDWLKPKALGRTRSALSTCAAEKKQPLWSLCSNSELAMQTQAQILKQVQLRCLLSARTTTRFAMNEKSGRRKISNASAGQRCAHAIAKIVGQAANLL